MRRAQFAVVTGEITGAGASDQWLLRGVTFDLEKRLGRLPNLEAADRLDVAGAVRAAIRGTEQAQVAAVMDRIQPDFVLYAFGSLSKAGLNVVVHVWADSRNSAATLNAGGSLNRLFPLIDDLTGQIVAHLKTTRIDLGAVRPTASLHMQPARSVSTYRLIIRGMTALQEGRAAIARPDLVNALQAEPDNWWAHYFLGAVEFHEGHFQESAEHCRKVIALDPDLYPGVYANLLYCYQGLGDSEQAKWAQNEFERRTGKTLPLRALAGGGFSIGIQAPTERKR